jgi:hypothetical protein
MWRGLGDDWYARITAADLFSIQKPGTQPGIGFEALPESFRSSEVLTGNHLARLANVSVLPVRDIGFKDERHEAIMQYFKPENNLLKRIHLYAKELIDDGKIEQAWQVLLADSSFERKH